MTHDLEDAMGEAMRGVRRDVEAAVRIPPYELVLRRHHRRRRRTASAGGVALAALLAAGFALVPALRTHQGTDTMTSAVGVSVAPAQGPGALSLADVSFADSSQGVLLGRRCAQSCHDVVSTTTDGGRTYGAETTVPGSHRYVAAGGDGIELAYAPDLAVSTDSGASWAALAAPAPVADVSVSDGAVLVLLTPAGATAQLWSGPLDATSWAGYSRLGDVPGSDDTARLQRPTPSSLLVVSDGDDQPVVATATLTAGTLSPWYRRALAECGAGAVPSVSAVSPEIWWVACEGQRSSGGGEAVGLTTDAGASFTDVSPPASAGTVAEVTALTPETAYLAGGPALLVTSDSGGTWSTALDQPALATPHVPAGLHGVDVWVVQPGTATVFRTTDGGATWPGLRLR